jgi:ubiquinone/menaquinone biosynthesis C-methylase UbiE
LHSTDRDGGTLVDQVGGEPLRAGHLLGPRVAVGEEAERGDLDGRLGPTGWETRTRAKGAGMGIYRGHVLPRIINVACGMKANEPLRDRVCAGLHGQVVEIGFGSGLNVPHYPAAVTGVAAIEPADIGWKLARRRLAATRVAVQRTGLDGQALPLPDHSCDTALSTWTMCTIPDIATALQEVRRVLKPGGTLHFIEHGLAPDEKVQRLQHRLEPVQKRLFGGCHLTRQIPELLTEAGFTITDLDTFYEEGAPKFLAAEAVGVAVAP